MLVLLSLCSLAGWCEARFKQKTLSAAEIAWGKSWGMLPHDIDLHFLVWLFKILRIQSYAAPCFQEPAKRTRARCWRDR